jgi:type I restriction enzyme S subunit
MGQSPKGIFTNNIREGLPLIGGAADLEDGRPKANRYTSRPTKVCRPGDIILCVRATIGKIAKADREYCLGRGVAAIESDSIDGDFLRLYLGACVKQLGDLGTGSTFKQISKDDLYAFPIAFAPLPEQRRIVAKIEALFEQSRTAHQALDCIPPLLKKFRQSVLAAAFRGDLTGDWREQHRQVEPAQALLERIRTRRRREWEAHFRAQGRDPRKMKYQEPMPVDTSNLPGLPEGWVWINMDALISDARYGTSQKCTVRPHGVGVLRIPNVVGGRIDLTDLKFADLNDRELKSLLVRPGDLLVVRTNGSLDLVGKAALVSDLRSPLAFASYLIQLRPVFDSTLPQYLNLVFCSGFVRGPVEEKARSTAGQFNVNLETLRSIRVPLCPADEMRRVVEIADTLWRQADAIEVAVNAAQRRADKLDQSILTRAFSGELVRQDPNDEPASVLLERIRAERPRSNTSEKSSSPKGKKRQGRKGTANM